MRSEAYAKINKVSQYSAIRGCCLITGEILDIDFESTATRAIKLPFDRGDIDLDKLTYYQNHLMNLPTFIYGFIAFLGSKIQTVFNIIQQEFSCTRKRAFPNNMAARFIDTIAIMSAETRIFYMYALEQGFLTPDQANSYRAHDMAYIEQIVMKNYIDTQAKSPAAMILLALSKAISKKEIPVYTPVDRTEVKTAKEIEEAVLIDDMYLFILPERLWEIYKKDCKEMGRNLTYKNGRELVQPLKKENAIILKSEGKASRATHKINAPTSKRFFIIDLTIFNKLCGIFEEF